MARLFQPLTHQQITADQISISSDTAPDDAPFLIQPSAAPTSTGASGAMYFDSTKNALMAHNGTSFTEVGQLLNYQIIPDQQNQVAAASYAVSHTIWVAPNVAQTWKVVAVSAAFGTASTSGTLQCEVATGTQAIAAGTNQLTSTISLSGTANTTVNGTIIGSPTTIAAGNRINLIFGGTVTNLANAIVTVALQRLT